MEKRRNLRIKKRLLVKINNQTGILVDISRTGFRLSTAAIPGSRDVDIILQADNKTFHIKGCTRWVSRKVAAQTLYDIGIAVEKASEEYHQFLDKLLSQHINGEAHTFRPANQSSHRGELSITGLGKSLLEKIKEKRLKMERGEN